MIQWIINLNVQKSDFFVNEYAHSINRHLLIRRGIMNKIAKLFSGKKTEEQFASARGTHIKVLFSSENPSLLGGTVKTKAIELSPKSIRLEVSHPVEINSVLDISVTMENSERSYNLTGNIRWRLPSTQGRYQAILVLRERMDIRTDFKAWKDNFEQNFEYDKVAY